MQITKAVITAAGRNQRTLPLQRIVDRDGSAKPVLQIIVEEALGAGVETVVLVVAPGDGPAYMAAAGPHAERLVLVEQPAPRGYGHALACAATVVGNEPFLHLVGDHLYLSNGEQGCAARLVALAVAEQCAISAVQPTRESLLPLYGAVGGRLLPGRNDTYQIERVLEKPTPTEAEQQLLVPGLRAGHYLCFFGMHVLPPTVFELLDEELRANNDGAVALSPALHQLASRERYLALANLGRRYDVGGSYGLLTAGLALALAGRDREEILAQLVELLATRKT
ncbi:MAG: sugar phosphate nucleotidyltransferase [Chloroflexaceae bacterium]|nr:sugar phosphate nucleotidyltransferase [Chloroflexaceae bacterium]